MRWTRAAVWSVKIFSSCPNICKICDDSARSGHCEIQHHLAKLGRIFDAHAAVAESAALMREKALLRGVVQIHLELVREIELDPAQSIRCSRRLNDVDIAVAAALHLEPHPREDQRSLSYCGSSSFWMIDCGTYQDGLTITVFIEAESSGVGVCGLPATILVRQNQAAVLDDAQRVVRHIDHHVGAAEIAWQPAPALHIGGDGLTRFASFGR